MEPWTQDDNIRRAHKRNQANKDGYYAANQRIERFERRFIQQIRQKYPALTAIQPCTSRAAHLKIAGEVKIARAGTNRRAIQIMPVK
jgi:hypothetical protein